MVENTMDKKDVAPFIQRYLRGECTPEEAARVEEWYNQFIKEREGNLPSLNIDQIQAESLANIQFRRHLSTHNHREKRMTKTFFHIAAAAIILITVSFTAYYFIGLSSRPETLVARNYVIEPGRNKAQITLANGTYVQLSEDKDGIIVKNGGIHYSDGTNIDKITWNSPLLILSTPSGGQYQVTLSDGSKVWLNAGSTLKYPTHFTGKKRQVELSGEAYFEVSHLSTPDSRTKIPFIVKTRNQDVEVLGTQFNINAYNSDQLVKTTLLEGSVRIIPTAGKLSSVPYRVLKPSEQATLNNANSQVTVKSVNPQNAVAWKNGYFAFDNENITNVMNTIARWYDIEVVYEGDIQGKVFTGTLSRFESFEKLLKTIGLTGTIHFKIEGRRVTVVT